MSKLTELWNELLEQNPLNDDLCYVIEYVDSLREVAGRTLLERDPSNDDIRYVIEHVDSLREVAESMLKRTVDEILSDMQSVD